MRLSKHGDPHEKRYWDSFIAECFPSYEAFWRAHVAPLTRRSIDPDDIGFLSREDLAKRADEDIAVAQLHSTLRHALTHHGLWIAALRGERNSPSFAEGLRRSREQHEVSVGRDPLKPTYAEGGATWDCYSPDGRRHSQRSA